MLYSVQCTVYLEQCLEGLDANLVDQILYFVVLEVSENRQNCGLKGLKKGRKDIDKTLSRDVPN